MSKAENQFRTYARLRDLGISADDAQTLRRISMTLSRWGERECGDEHGNAIERDETTGIPYATYDLGANGKRGRHRIPDRERGALKRLAAVMAQYPALVAYHQTDPRGCALYVVKRSDLGGASIESVYTRGVAVGA
jgi:hypothetical protein